MPVRHFGRDRYRLDSSGTVLLWEGRRATGSDVPAGEIYLRLAEIDLRDPAQICDFANTYDKLNVHEASLWNPSFHLTVTPEEAQEISTARERMGSILVHEQPDGFSNPAEAARSDFDSESVEGFRIAAAVLRDALYAWRFLRGEIDFDEHEWESGEYRRTWKYAKGKTRKEQRTQFQVTAIDVLTDLFDSALHPFHPGVTFDHTTLGSRGSTAIELVASHERQALDLYPICALELYKHIVEDTDYSVCQNETCGRLFVRQQGRAQYGQHRTRGVLYCTNSCARAQAQRAYRRRERSKGTNR